jgi:hypothetical protein
LSVCLPLDHQAAVEVDVRLPRAEQGAWSADELGADADVTHQLSR